MELKDLEKLTVPKLREEAAKFEDIKGVHGLKKAQLIDLLCEKLDIHRPKTKVVGIDKSVLKARIRDLKAKREAIPVGDHEALAEVRMRIKVYKRAIHRYTLSAG